MHDELTTELKQRINTFQAWKYYIIPKFENKEKIVFLTSASHWKQQYVKILSLILEKKIEVEFTEHKEILYLLNKFYPRKNDNTTFNLSLENDKFLEQLLLEAESLNSSDIHIERFENNARIRYRIDGILVEKYKVPLHLYPSLINRIKILSKLDIAEKRLPQDGRISIKKDSNAIDIRVSILPAVFGEKAVLRILSKNASLLSLSSLNMSDIQYHYYTEGMKRSDGLILISGPTGSGKTSTLYATLKELNHPEINILTIEDPVEYILDGINQVQLKENIGLTFSEALRTFLRQDPNVIMLGEIRDEETANMAIRASLTGHMVLSTIHTNSATGIVSRLINMGIPSYLVAQTLNLAVAQRLVRKLCENCKKQQPFHKNLLPHNYKMPYDIPVHYIPGGCEECLYTGYNGRISIFEIIYIDKDIQKEIIEKKDIPNEIIRNKKIETLSLRDLKLLQTGKTSINEIYPILQSSQ